jgi:hypothetical protein
VLKAGAVDARKTPAHKTGIQMREIQEDMSSADLTIWEISSRHNIPRREFRGLMIISHEELADYVP